MSVSARPETTVFTSVRRRPEISVTSDSPCRIPEETLPSAPVVEAVSEAICDCTLL